MTSDTASAYKIKLQRVVVVQEAWRNIQITNRDRGIS